MIRLTKLLKESINEAHSGFLYLDIPSKLSSLDKTASFFISGIEGEREAKRIARELKRDALDVKVDETAIKPDDAEYIEGETHVVYFSLPRDGNKQAVLFNDKSYKVTKNMKDLAKDMESIVNTKIRTDNYW